MALSTISTSSYTPGDTTTGDNNNDSSIYQLLLDRCRSLEASYANLQEQFHMLEQEQTLPSTHNVNHHHHGKLLHDAANVSSSSYNDWISVPDVLPVGFSYKRALDQLGHAVYVSKADTREIIYWIPRSNNRSQERHHMINRVNRIIPLLKNRYNKSSFRSVPAGFTRSVPAEVTRSVPAVFTRSVPAEITRSVPNNLLDR
nr:PAS domain-containing protein tyrosine kinase family protein [Tanacetum cinerariifolium]